MIRRDYRRKRKPGFFERISNFSVVINLIIINVLAYIVYFILSLIYGPEIIKYVALNPSNFLEGKYLWTLFTHMFMHGNFFHLFINMFAFFSLGIFTERIIGRKRFFRFYIVSGLFAGLLSVLLAGFFGESYWGALIFGSSNIPMVGASGAIFGVAGLIVFLLPKTKFSIIFFPFIGFRGYVLVPLALVIMWVISIIAELPIGNVAHFGGFMCGLVYGIYLRKRYRKKLKVLESMMFR